MRELCGIALSNSHCIPAMFTASMVIAVCMFTHPSSADGRTHISIIGGDLFVDYEEQKAMLDILQKTDVDLAWPTASAQRYLCQEWGWNDHEMT